MPQSGRHSIRLKDFDYSQVGAYFVTICVRNRECLLGNVCDGEMKLNEYGKVAAESWQWLAGRFANIELDECIIMPNHKHGIIDIQDDEPGRATCPRNPKPLVRSGSRIAPTGRKPLGRLIGAFKTVSTKRINELRKTPGAKLWQRNYFEHVVRNPKSLDRIREYILTNPERWESDKENPLRYADDEFDRWLETFKGRPHKA